MNFKIQDTIEPTMSGALHTAVVTIIWIVSMTDDISYVQTVFEVS